MTMNYDDSVYRELEAEAAKDDRLGHQTMMITEVLNKTWPSGDPFIEIKGQLVTANNAKISMNFSPLPSPEVIKAEKDSWTPAKKKGIAASIAAYRQLQNEYGKTPETLNAGDELNVNIVKNKEGFLRVAAILGKNAKAAVKLNGSPNDPPF